MQNELGLNALIQLTEITNTTQGSKLKTTIKSRLKCYKLKKVVRVGIREK